MFSQFPTQVTIWISPVFWIQITFWLDSPFDCNFLGFFFSTWAPGIGRKCRVLISYVMTTLLYFFFLPCDSRREFQNQGEERDVAVKNSTWLWIPCEMMAPGTTASEKKKIRYESTETHTTPPPEQIQSRWCAYSNPPKFQFQWMIVVFHLSSPVPQAGHGFYACRCIFIPSIRPFLWKKKKKKGERKRKKGTRRKDVCWLVDLPLSTWCRWEMGWEENFQKKRKKRVILGVCMKTHREDVDTGGDIMDRGSAATVATAAPSRSEKLARL